MKKTSSLRRVWLSLVGVALALCVVRTPLKWHDSIVEAACQQAQPLVRQVEPQGNEKIIVEAYSSNPQLRVTKLKTGPEVRQLNEPFGETENWLEKLSLELENISEKPIVYLQVNLNLPETKHSGSMMSYPFEYGLRPGSKLVSSNEPIKLMPGEKLTVSVDPHYQRLTRFVETRHSLKEIHKLQVEIGFIIFDDRTAWVAGDFLRQDPNNPDRYGNGNANPRKPQ